MKRAMFPALVAALLTWLTPWTAAAFDWRDPLAARNSEANTLAEKGEYDKALDTYKAAQVDAPESPELHYNIGLALASERKYEEAIQSFNNMISSKETLKSKTHYNIGVCQYRMGMAAEEAGDYQKALDQLQAAMESNREAMRIDPADADAKYNFEQAKRAWKELYDKIKQQQKEQPQSQPQNQQQNQSQSRPASQPQDQQQNQQGQNDQQKEGQPQHQEEQSSSQPTSR
ncbi:MAG: tetratricopeptide repeat protein, partial [Candidatus Sumerlaeota bacterium]|nr:tetratricopeptide repeat protein [Candidatus Sumerlaeota bacterium]